MSTEVFIDLNLLCCNDGKTRALPFMYERAKTQDLISLLLFTNF